MSFRITFALLLGILFAVGADASSGKHRKDAEAKAQGMRVRKDPAFRAGYDNGWRQGANDSEALSNTYKDEVGPIYDLATDGYTPQYGDRDKYQKLFRLGYVAGYKSGWDFNAGQYCAVGCGGGGP